MDIKEKVTELVEKIKGDKGVAERFTKDPMATVQSLLGGVKLPTDQLEKIVEGVKAKVSLDKVSGALGGLFGKK